MKASLAIPDETFLKRYFVWLKPMLQELPAPLQYFFEKCYPHYDLVPASSRTG